MSRKEVPEDITTPINIAAGKLHRELKDGYGKEPKIHSLQDMFARASYMRHLNMKLMAGVYNFYENIKHDPIGFFSSDDASYIFTQTSGESPPTIKENTLLLTRDNYLQNCAYILHTLSTLESFARQVIPYLKKEYIQSLYNNKQYVNLIQAMRKDYTGNIRKAILPVEMSDIDDNNFSSNGKLWTEARLIAQINNLDPYGVNSDKISDVFRYALRNNFTKAVDKLLNTFFLSTKEDNKVSNYVAISTIGSEKLPEKNPKLTLHILNRLGNVFGDVDTIENSPAVAKKLNQYKGDMYRYFKFLRENKLR